MEELKVKRATSPLIPIALSGLAALLLFGSSTATAAVNTYSDLESFLLATGSSELSDQDFDGFESGTFINDQIPGVVFSSPNQDHTGYLEIQTADDPGAASRPNVLNGGSVPGSPTPLQTMYLDFSPSITAFAFNLCDYLPAATAATVKLEFDDDSSATFPVSNTTVSELTPVFFGAISDIPIFRVVITSGVVGERGYEEYTIDDLRYGQAALADTDPPVCSSAPAVEGGNLGINGRASDTREGDTGIESVALKEGQVNLALMVDPEFQPGDGTVSFRVVQLDAERDGRGTVVVTDGGGNTCIVPATFRTLGPGPLSDETICTGEGLLLSVSNDNSTLAGTSACSANLPNATEPPFPPGYDPSPADDPFPCRVLTIESPVHGLTHMTLKKDGVFDPRLRLLATESQDGGSTFPPFIDVTEFVEPIDSISPDPTRIGDKFIWSPVKVACALQSETSRLAYCATLGGAPGPDADGDTFTLCGSSTKRADCNDQRNFINPDAHELCNGLDDNCDGTIDDGHPTEGAGEPCTIPGLSGACFHGLTSCENGPRICKQTVFPIQEVACNGVDDDCDGRTDETYAFSDYLPPIKPDGSTAFLKKRGAIPVKFQLRNCAGAPVANAVATIEVHFVMNGVIGNDPVDISSVGNANTDNLYRSDAGGNYIYNLNASLLRSNSVYLIRTHLDDGTTHDVFISIK
jgi:putative metal-binding protein